VVAIAHIQAAGGGNVAGLLRVASHQAGQQAQAQGVVAVGLAGPLDLGPAAPHTLSAEESHRVGGLHLGQLLFPAALQQVAAVGFQGAGPQAGGHQHFGTDPRQAAQAAQVIFGNGADAILLRDA